MNKIDQGVYDLFNNTAVAWENSSPSVAFEAQTISILSDRAVLYYEILFAYSSSNTNNLGSTGKIQMGLNTTCSNSYHGVNKTRYVTASQDTDTGIVSFVFENGYSGTTAGSGNCIPYRILFYYERSSDIATATAITSAQAVQAVETTQTYASQAFDFANTADDHALLSKSWAVGDTGERDGEDTNCAKYWSDVARQAAVGDIDLTDYYNKSEVDDFLDDKVSAEDGKGLSTNDFTDEYKESVQQIITPLLAGARNNGLYRGKNLGVISSVAEMDAFITEHGVNSGEFIDLYLGDYITIQDGTYNADWIIAGFDTQWMNSYIAGVEPPNNFHHLAMIPKISIAKSIMTSTTVTGYANSTMHLSTLPSIVNILQTVLGGHLKQNNCVLSNQVQLLTNMTYANTRDGVGYVATNSVWTLTYAVLMTEVQVYGYRDVTVSHKDIGEGWRKLPVFNYISPVQFAYEEWWLRNIANTTCYTYVYREGGADYFAANNQKGVRPLILIG